jgi:outer membrane protein assembly factor BamD (BamD/ComL family)
VILGARSIVLLLAAATATAPFQCARKVDPEQRLEEEPAEALYNLAERFKAQGDEHARAETLRYLVQKYPSSRFALMAKDDLQAMPGK